MQLLNKVPLVTHHPRKQVFRLLLQKQTSDSGDDETEKIQNYSRMPQNLLNLLQPGACPSPSP